MGSDGPCSGDNSLASGWLLGATPFALGTGAPGGEPSLEGEQALRVKTSASKVAFMGNQTPNIEQRSSRRERGKRPAQAAGR